MESPEEVAAAASSSSYSSADGAETTTTTKTSFTKRKRTKRLRSFSSGLPPAAPPPPPPPNEEEDYFSTSTTTTEEDEKDMAHCLILLAQGGTAGAGSSLVPSPRREEIKLTATANTATATDAKAAAGLIYVYECKTCNKCFPSFQALGGHRASHKKPKPAPVAVKADVTDHDVGGLEIISMNPSFARVVNIAPAANNKLQLRVHECSICGSEFASGQALGGHMRRHRPVGGATATATAADSPEAANSSSKISRCMLSLDLNLPPAPSEEENAFVDRRPLALVDCHY